MSDVPSDLPEEAEPPIEVSDPLAVYPESQTGAKLDPIDGMPLFGEFDGTWMSRDRYLQASRSKRQAEALAELRQSIEDDHAAVAAGSDDDADA